jgi:hypothetical protein
MSRRIVVGGARLHTSVHCCFNIANRLMFATARWGESLRESLAESAYSTSPIAGAESWRISWLTSCPDQR